MTSKLTKEWLQHQISAIEAVGITDSNTLAAFTLALAAMDSEPVAWTDEQELRDVDRGGCGYLFTVNPVTPHADERRIILLYRHAQPAPVELANIALPHSWLDGEGVEVMSANEVKRACRAAMLAAAPQSPGSEPATVPCKWIPVSERMPEDRTQVILWDAEIGEVTSGHYSHKTQTFYHCGDAIENEITHWMAPPAAPQEVRGE